MAVVQISRIQIRRGRANSGTGFPQLASGELGWALDTQELYIGNGSVAEGSPAVGNTKILTENDLVAQGNLLNLLQHVYKANDPSIITGPDANNPITRFVQDRLDDRVTVTDFGAEGDDVNDDTEALQRAIDQLFLNPTTKASANTIDGVKTRIVLEIPPGTFNISDTLYIPSYATIIGAGPDKTKIIFDATKTVTGSTTISSATLTTASASSNMIGATITGVGIQSNTTILSVNPGVSVVLSKNATATNSSETFVVKLPGPAIQFVNDSSSIGNPSSINTTLGNTQPRHIILKGFSIEVDSDQISCLQLDAVKDSVFEDLLIQGSWNLSVNNNSRGIAMNAVSDIVTCESNQFNRLVVQGFSHGIYAKQDIKNNTFNDCYFNDLNRGFSLGQDANQSTIGEQFGPRGTIISNCRFYEILQHAVYIEVGTDNTVSNCNVSYVGNNGGDHTYIQYPQVYLGKYGNTVENLISDRTKVLGRSSYRIEKVDLTLSSNITASKGAYVTQAITGAYGYLYEDVVDSNTVTLTGIFTYLLEVSPGVFESVSIFDTTHNLTIAGDSTPSTTNTAVHPSNIDGVTVSSYINYIPEVSGYGSFIAPSQQVSLSEFSTFSKAFKLPVSTDGEGNPQRSIFYTVNYQYKSISFNFIRKGRMEIAVSVEDGLIHFSDEYDYVGNEANSLKMEFRARLVDDSGVIYSGDPQIPFGIEIQYTNTLSGDSGGVFVYDYTSSF